MQADRAFNLGVRYLDCNEIEMAVIAFSQAIVSNPKMAQAYNGRSVARAITGDLPNALADAMEAVQLDPGDPEFYRTRSYVYDRLGDREKSEADLLRADQLEGRVAY